MIKIKRFKQTLFIALLRAKKMIRKKISSIPVKHYTYMVTGGGLIRHVNIVAIDRPSAQLSIEKLYPGVDISFLWEYTRTVPEDLIRGSFDRFWNRK